MVWCHCRFYNVRYHHKGRYMWHVIYRKLIASELWTLNIATLSSHFISSSLDERDADFRQSMGSHPFCVIGYASRDSSSQLCGLAPEQNLHTNRPIWWSVLTNYMTVWWMSSQKVQSEMMVPMQMISVTYVALVLKRTAVVHFMPGTRQTVQL